MKIKKFSKKPDDINDRIGAKPIVCYPNNNIEEKNLDILHTARKNLVKKNEILIPPRDAKTFEVKEGEFHPKDENGKNSGKKFSAYFLSLESEDGEDEEKPEN